MNNAYKILTTLFFSCAAHASTMLPAAETYQSTRSAGMAGASVAVADDESAIFSNPAGIGQEDDPGLTLRGFSLPNMSVGMNSEAYRIFNEMKPSAGGFKNIENIVESGSNKSVYFRGTSFPYVTVSRIQLGLLVDATAQATQVMNDGTLGVGWDRSLNAWQRSQAGVVAGFSVPHRHSGLSAGISTRYTIRTSYFENVFQTGETITRTETRVNRTRGLALDGGLLFDSTGKKIWVPSVGLAVRDFGTTLYKGTGVSDNPELEKANFMAGATWRLMPGKKEDTQILCTVEGHHLNDTRLSGHDKLRVGAEFRLAQRVAKTPLAVRVGHNRQGFSYGASINLMLLKFEFGSMVEAVPTEVGATYDRRNFARLSVDLRN